MSSSSQPIRRAPLPPGAASANWFGLFNAMSWQITLGSPIILYAKSLGASSTVLGLIASLTPLLVILQIPAAHLLPKYGYRKFILAGWGSRTVCIFGLAVVPLLTYFEAYSRLWFVLLFLMGFNILRGMASGAWMPWMSQIIPEGARARFLSRDQMFAQIGCLVSLSMAAVTLSQDPKPWQFALVFLFSALGATTSLLFLKRIPDITAPEQLRASGTRVPYAHMIAYPPFLRLTLFNLLFVCAVGGMGVFTISFLRSQAQYSERLIVLLSASSVLGAIFVLPHTAKVLDRWGSRPMMVACLCSFGLILTGWFSLAAGLMPYSVLLIGGLMLLSGITGVNFQVANNRLAMSIMPRMGRNHFFAMYTVITNMAAGLSPILWGVTLDAIGSWSRNTGALSWNRYSIFYCTAAVFAGVTACYGLKLQEKTSQLEFERGIGVAMSPQASGASPIAEGGAPTGTLLGPLPQRPEQVQASASAAEFAESPRV